MLLDEGSLKVALEQQRFFAKPKLALDAVGGTSASRLADALPEGGTLVTYGVMSGKSASFHWRNFLFAGLQVRRVPPLLGLWLQSRASRPFLCWLRFSLACNPAGSWLQPQPVHQGRQEEDPWCAGEPGAPRDGRKAPSCDHGIRGRDVGLPACWVECVCVGGSGGGVQDSSARCGRCILPISCPLCLHCSWLLSLQRPWTTPWSGNATPKFCSK